MTSAVLKLETEIQKRIAGVAMFGSTLYKSNKGIIPGFPADRAKSWCNKTDGVCTTNSVIITAGHLSYSSSDINAAANWLVSNVKRMAESA